MKITALFLGIAFTFSVLASAENSPEKLLETLTHKQEYTAKERDAMYTQNWRREITDADFFGSYKDGSWVKRPMLDYASKPGLQRVEEAAKAGEYEQAGTEILAYFKNRTTDPKAKPRGAESPRIKLWKDLFFGFDQQIHLVNEFEIQREPKPYSVDIKRFVMNGQIVFHLMGRHKNGVVSQVSSRESANPPVLELHFKDGTTNRITASADSFIRAGAFADQNYGTAETLEVCNSGLKTAKPFDGDTRETLIRFDISQVDLNKLEGAQLILKAWSSEPNQKLVIFRPRETVVDEKTITWNKNTGYLYCWEGLPGGVDWNPPKGAHSQFIAWTGRIYWFDNLASWAIASNDPEAGKVVFALIRDYIADYPKLEQRGNELNSSARLGYFTQLLPYLFKVDACTPRDCVELLKAVVRDGTDNYIDYAQVWGANSGNVGPGIFSAMVKAGLAWPEFSDSKGWIENATDRLEKNLKSMVLDDGAYIEHTFGYPYGVLQNLLNLLKVYSTNNLKTPAVLAAKTQQLARYLMFCSLPTGTPPPWGEGGPKNSVSSPVIKTAASYFNDPELTWWVSQGKNGHVPAVTNVSYPSAKIGVLRSSWQADANVMFFSPRVGGGHYHVDQNAIVLYAYGRNLLDDTGMSSYSFVHPHFDWQRHQTKSHNTVEVDERGFPRMPKGAEEGPCASSVSTSTHAGLMEGWADGYPAVRHNRTLFWLKEAGLYFVFDLLKPKDEKVHTYDQCWHFNPANTFESDPKTCKVWTTNKDAANLEIVPVYPQRLELLLRKGFNASTLQDTLYPSFRQKIAGNAEFMTLLNPRRPGEAARDLNGQWLDASNGARAVRITPAEGDGIFIVSHAQGKVKAATVETDARCAYVQFGKAGQVSWAARAGGTSLNVNGLEIPCEVMTELAPPALPAPNPNTPMNAK